MTQLLVFGEREDAEEVAGTLGEWFPEAGVPRVLRETLAGEDDAEDAQWVVVVEGLGEHVLAKVDELVERYDGWRESG
jgi:alpha-beta hydrolase superfamily lysophospholipase